MSSKTCAASLAAFATSTSFVLAACSRRTCAAPVGVSFSIDFAVGFASFPRSSKSSDNGPCNASAVFKNVPEAACTTSPVVALGSRYFLIVSFPPS